ncbi:hypothetical protein ACFQY0_13880 [Haloferula chungangensis]|uniref:Uncharacterized protein n=1 Tax=Haloferula chungangensis TaxID=1048331 RepID=A0ABW2L797_9BACT
MNGPELQPGQAATLRDHLRLQRNAVGLALMLGAIAIFITFHFLKIRSDYGWELWVAFFNFLSSSDSLKDSDDLLGFSGFIALTIGTLVSPVLIKWMIHNPWLKWCLATFAAMAAGIMWYFAIRDEVFFIAILALVPTFTLAGLICIETVPHSPVRLDS